MSIHSEMQATIEAMVQPRKGILAADESHPTIAKRFAAIEVDSSEEHRRQWRSLLLTTPQLGDCISGIILFEETLGQVSDDDQPLPAVAEAQGIVPGIKVDKGTIALVNAPGDKITQGLDGLADRLSGYKQQGARFAKWREVYPITDHNPTPLGISANAEVLARYAAICQSVGIVPIVEPEVLMDGVHDIERAAEVITGVHQAVYQALHCHRVVLEHTILKPSMVTPGKAHPHNSSPEQIAHYTVSVLKRSVPAAVPSINFLSGGQGDREATENLNAMNKGLPNLPWQLSFSYGRALQHPALMAWQGKRANIEAAQQALLHRARMNGAARSGNYDASLDP